MVYVCDAIMGSGKSQSCISYINNHLDKHFVYITPYLPEAERIATNCPDAKFVQPSNKLPEYQFSKVEHTRALMREGKNIASTHVAFRAYTSDMIEAIKKYNYTLIVDEAVDVFQKINYNQADVQLLVDGGYAEFRDGAYHHTGKEYIGSRLRDMYLTLRCNNLIPVEYGKSGYQYYYWTLPIDILSSFNTVFILTYLFETSEMKAYMDHYGMMFQNIGIRRDGDVYQFAETMEYIPEYVSHIKDMLHIFNNAKLNDIGKNKRALSANWMKNNADQRTQLKNNMYSFFRYYMKASKDRILWATYKENIYWLRGRGYANQYVAFNMKASNEYRDRDVLAYCVNIFPAPEKFRFFQSLNMKYDADGNALSTMVQWIWRSAIRDGKPVDIYIPSRRMRGLLEDWIECLTAGEDR